MGTIVATGTDQNNNKVVIYRNDMPTTIARTSHEKMERLLRKEFDNNTKPWQHQEAKELIKTAEDYNMCPEFIQELKNDL